MSKRALTTGLLLLFLVGVSGAPGPVLAALVEVAHAVGWLDN